MGELLVFHKILDKPSDLDEDNFEEVIMEFQAKVDILIDGDPKWETLWSLQYPWVLSINKKLPFVKCDADLAPGSQGYDFLWLREDAAEKYKAIRKEVLDKGGIITTAGGKRSLLVGSNASRSATSMHYTGLAFDLAIDSGFFNPDKDPFIITRDNVNNWTVFVRAKKGIEQELEALYWKHWNSGVDYTKKVTGKFINFTKICSKNGFYPIKPKTGFTYHSNRKYLSSEWWHFQANDLLIPYLSQFGIELLRIEGYTADYIGTVNTNLWSRKKVIFQIDWF
jgi:hypothetical protein